MEAEKAEIERDFEEAAKVQNAILTEAAEYHNLPGLEVDVFYRPMNGLVSGDDPEAGCKFPCNIRGGLNLPDLQGFRVVFCHSYHIVICSGTVPVVI